MRRKVLFVPSWYPSADDPISGVFIQEQAHALSERYDVAVLIPGMASWRNVARTSSPDRSQLDKSGPVPVYREFALPLVPHGPESIDYQTYVRSVQSGYKKIIKDFGKPDIIHAHVVLPGGWSALNLGEQHGIPVVLTEHSSPFSMHLDTELKRGLVRKTLNSVKQVIAISPALARQLLGFEPTLNPTIIGELVNTDFFVPGVATSGNGYRTPITRFFVVARLAEQKGLTHLLHAVELLQQRNKGSFELWLGGDGPDRRQLQQLANDLGIAARCKFLGALNRTEVREWMQKSDVFVLSSLHETFGVVVGEAMACGKPVISTKCGGPEFIVTDENGVLVDVASAESLANAMSELMLSKHNFSSDQIRTSVVSRFGAQTFVQNISSIYESLW